MQVQSYGSLVEITSGENNQLEVSFFFLSSGAYACQSLPLLIVYSTHSTHFVTYLALLGTWVCDFYRQWVIVDCIVMGVGSWQVFSGQ